METSESKLLTDKVEIRKRVHKMDVLQSECNLFAMVTVYRYSL